MDIIHLNMPILVLSVSFLNDAFSIFVLKIEIELLDSCHLIGVYINIGSEFIELAWVIWLAIFKMVNDDWRSLDAK